MLSGKSGEWNSFIFQFSKTAHYYGWDQRDKADCLLSTQKDALEQRFGKLEHSTAVHRHLTYVWQEEGESLEDFADRTLTQVTEA